MHSYIAQCFDRLKSSLRSRLVSQKRPTLFSLITSAFRRATDFHVFGRHTVPCVGFRAHVCYHCRISPPRLLAECRKRRLNRDSFVFAVF